MEYIVIAVLIVGAFVAGFFVGKKNGFRLGEIEARIKDALGKK